MSKVEEYIADQPAHRQSLLSAIHSIIMEGDSFHNVLVSDHYFDENEGEDFKYEIVYVKKIIHFLLYSCSDYIQLDAVPLCFEPELGKKYKTLLPKASVNEGSIRFTSEDELPLDILRQMVSECAKYNIRK